MQKRNQCAITGKRTTVGHHKSHAHNLVKRRFKPNLQSKRYWVDSLARFVRIKVCPKGIRMIDKHGIEKYLQTVAE